MRHAERSFRVKMDQAAVLFYRGFDFILCEMAEIVNS
jgi:hypothetical protein